jgi:hypothetical protein
MGYKLHLTEEFKLEQNELEELPLFFTTQQEIPEDVPLIDKILAYFLVKRNWSVYYYGNDPYRDNNKTTFDFQKCGTRKILTKELLHRWRPK